MLSFIQIKKTHTHTNKKKIQRMATQTLNTKFHPICRHEEIGANAYASRIIRKL